MDGEPNTIGADVQADGIVTSIDDSVMLEARDALRLVLGAPPDAGPAPHALGGDPDWLFKMRFAGMMDASFSGAARVSGDPPFMVVRLKSADGAVLKFRLPLREAWLMAEHLVEWLAIYRALGSHSWMSSGTSPSADPNGGHVPSPEDKA